MKKVLMIAPSDKLKGGIATVISNYRNYKFKDDINIKYLSTIYTTNKYINMILFPFIIIKFLMYVINVDIVHIHMASRGSFRRKSILINIAYVMNKSIIIHLHGAEFHVFYDEATIRKKKNISQTLDKAEFIVVLSEEWRERISIMTKGDIIVINNAVPVPNRIIYNGLGEYITFIGRLDARKGIFDLLDIANNIEKIDNSIKIVLCGDGNLEKIEDVISANNSKNIILKGWINSEEKEEILSKALINILPSYNEGMPMSILEAMSYGIPTIATNVGGIPRVIIDEENGFMTIPGDKSLILKRIEEIVNNVDIKNKISVNAYNSIKKNFGLEAHIKKIEYLYESINI